MTEKEGVGGDFSAFLIRLIGTTAERGGGKCGCPTEQNGAGKSRVTLSFTIPKHSLISLFIISLIESHVEMVPRETRGGVKAVLWAPLLQSFSRTVNNSI